MDITPEQKRLCTRVVNVFETGAADGNYAIISIYADGPHGMRQITYGRSQTTEYGNLRELVIMYVQNHGQYAGDLAPYIPRIRVEPLVGDKVLKGLLADAARNDPVMRATQDAFFDRRYWKPALEWASTQGFAQALSALVIYDSFIHSGSVLDFLRSRFPEPVPANGGQERQWTKEYVDARHDWLRKHPKAVLQKTVYRTQCFKREIARDNWDLSLVPIVANGVKVS